MCRMIFAAGKFDVNWLIDDIKKMASDNNEKHEENAHSEFKHSDGWGIAYLDGNRLKTFRSEKAIYEDSYIHETGTVGPIYESRGEIYKLGLKDILGLKFLDGSKK